MDAWWLVFAETRSGGFTVSASGNTALGSGVHKGWSLGPSKWDDDGRVELRVCDHDSRLMVSPRAMRRAAAEALISEEKGEISTGWSYVWSGPVGCKE